MDIIDRVVGLTKRGCRVHSEKVQIKVQLLDVVSSNQQIRIGLNEVEKGFHRFAPVHNHPALEEPKKSSKLPRWYRGLEFFCSVRISSLEKSSRMSSCL